MGNEEGQAKRLVTFYTVSLIDQKTRRVCIAGSTPSPGTTDHPGYSRGAFALRVKCITWDHA
jgi:hypothetical protein